MMSFASPADRVKRLKAWALRLLSVPLWLILTLAGLACAFLSRRSEMWIGRRLGRLVLSLGGYRRQIAHDNIRRCFPELGPAGWDALLKRNFEHYGILVLEFLHFFTPIPGHFKDYVRAGSRLEGAEHWRRARDKGRGVIFFSSHVGFWEMSAASAGLAGIAPTIVTTVLKPRWLHDRVTACRSSVGVTHAFHPGSIPAILRALRSGGSVAFTNDQYAGPPMGVPVPFFGVRVATLAAVGPLAKRTGAAIVPVSAYRDDDGIAHVVIEPEVDLGKALGSPEAATAILAARVERWVRRHPEQWLWIHRRFKNVVWPGEGAAPRPTPPRNEGAPQPVSPREETAPRTSAAAAPGAVSPGSGPLPR